MPIAIGKDELGESELSTMKTLQWDSGLNEHSIISIRVEHDDGHLERERRTLR